MPAYTRSLHVRPRSPDASSVRSPTKKSSSPATAFHAPRPGSSPTCVVASVSSTVRSAPDRVAITARPPTSISVALWTRRSIASAAGAQNGGSGSDVHAASVALASTIPTQADVPRTNTRTAQRAFFGAGFFGAGFFGAGFFGAGFFGAVFFGAAFFGAGFFGAVFFVSAFFDAAFFDGALFAAVFELPFV